MDNQRCQEFLGWIQHFLPSGFYCSDQLALTALTGDAGFRSYYRINTKPSLIAVDAPPQQVDNPSYVLVDTAFRQQGIHTPEIHAVDFSRGFLLIEDLGDNLFQFALDQQATDPLYGEAESVLLKLQSLAQDKEVFPLYNRQRLIDEMALFPHWFVGELLGVDVDVALQQILEELFDLLVSNALEQPQVVVHRDYHARNLMVLEDSTLGVIDFQDAVLGAITYDLVSLLRDCYVRHPESWVHSHALAYKNQAVASGLLTGVDDKTFLRWFDLMGLQRHIKVLGIFARLWLRDGKSGYLGDLPLVIRYTLEVARQYPETKALYHWFIANIEPRLTVQDWYRPWRTAGEDDSL